MTITRTISSIRVTNTVSISELIAISGDPTFANGLPGASSAGNIYKMDGSTGNGPAITKVFHGTVALVTGATTIDLTALVDATLGTVDMSGLKLRLLHVVAATANAGTISIAPGASDSYTGWVGTNGMLLSAGDSRGPDIFTGGIAIDSTHKDIDLAGTGTDSVVVIMGFGA